MTWRSVSGIDKSLDLEKFSKRNDSQFSLSSWRSEFSYLVLLSIFKILRKKFSFSSRFSRSYIEILFPLSIFKILKKDFSFSSRFMTYWYWKSLSLLDFQDYFLFSPINILKVKGPSHPRLLGGRPSSRLVNIWDFVPCFSSCDKLCIWWLRCHSPNFVWHPVCRKGRYFKRPIWVLYVVCHTDFGSQQLPMEKSNKSLLWCYF